MLTRSWRLRAGPPGRVGAAGLDCGIVVNMDRSEREVEWEFFKKGAIVLFGVTLLQAALAGAYLAAFHAPSPRRVPVAVVGSKAVADHLSEAARGALSVRVVSDRAKAEHDIRSQQIYAAYVPGQPATVLVASASGQSLASSLPADFAAVSQALGTTQHTVDLAPLPAGDPRGLSIFYLAFSWVFGGYFGAVALNAVRGDRRFLRRNAATRIIGFLIFAVGGSLSTVTIATFGVHAFPSGHYWTLAGLGALTMFSVTMAASALISVLGTAGTALVIVLFVVLGTPASDGAVAIQLTGGGPWKILTSVLPTGVAVRAVRSGVYLSGVNLVQYVVTLLAYAAGGAAILLGLGLRNSSVGYAQKPADEPA